MTAKISSDLLRGHTDTIILGILARGDSYGYDIYKQILELTGEEYELKEATLYSAIRRLEQDSAINAYWGDESQGGRRKYYHITQSGRETLFKNRTDWYFSKRILEKLIEEEQK